MHGNIEGLEDLFRRGQASPWDVSSTRSYTLSRVSYEVVWKVQSPSLDWHRSSVPYTSKQYKAAKFLTLAGSDLDHKFVSSAATRPDELADHYLDRSRRQTTALAIKRSNASSKVGLVVRLRRISSIS